MSSSAIAAPDAAPPAAAGWRAPLLALGFVAFAILALFFRDVADMVSIWWNASTFGHCLFVPLLIGWLVQQRLPGRPACCGWGRVRWSGCWARRRASRCSAMARWC